MCNFCRVTPGVTWTHLYMYIYIYIYIKLRESTKKRRKWKVQTVNKVGGKKPYSKMHEGPTIKPN